MWKGYLIIGTLGFTLLAANAPSVAAQERIDREMIGKLQEESRAHSQVLETYRTLTDDIGPRLTGSPAFKRAIDWTRDRLAKWGMSSTQFSSS